MYYILSAFRRKKLAALLPRVCTFQLMSYFVRLNSISPDVMSSAIMMFFDYRGFQNLFPGVQSLNKARSYITMILYCVLFMILVVLIYAFILWVIELIFV